MYSKLRRVQTLDTENCEFHYGNMEKQRTVMPVTETFMVKRALEITRLSAVKRKTQFANHCIAVKIAA